jgi:hypothetical protein
MGQSIDGPEELPEGVDRDYLRACRRVLAGGVLARDRAEVLAVEPGRWPHGAARLREKIAMPVRQGSPEAELEMLDLEPEFQAGLVETVELLIGQDDRLAEALLRLQIDCARVRYVFEETAMRLRVDPLRFAHSESHRRLLQRLSEARVNLHAGRADEVRAILAALRHDLAEHARSMDARSGSRDVARL